MKKAKRSDLNKREYEKYLRNIESINIESQIKVGEPILMEADEKKITNDQVRGNIQKLKKNKLTLQSPIDLTQSLKKVTSKINKGYRRHIVSNKLFGFKMLLIKLTENFKKLLK